MADVFMTSDGRHYVWCVFRGDGYECRDLIAVFSNEEDAESFRAVAENNVCKSWQRNVISRGHSCPEYVEIEMWVIGEGKMPALAQLTLETIPT